MSGEFRNQTIKEQFGFVEGKDIELFLIKLPEQQSRRLGYLRPDFGSVPRLFERFELELADAAGHVLYFGQPPDRPFEIALAQKERGVFEGVLENQTFRAHGVLQLVSPYNAERFVLTLELKLARTTGHKTAGDALPEAWLARDSQQ